MLFPVGLLLPIVVDGKAKKMAGLIVGTVFSVVIEILQLIFCRGLFEWDDIIHNSLGCMIGVMSMNKAIEIHGKHLLHRKNRNLKQE